MGGSRAHVEVLAQVAKKPKRAKFKFENEALPELRLSI